MADDGAHVVKHMTAARDAMAAVVARQQALEALIDAARAARVQELPSDPTDPEIEAQP